MWGCCAGREENQFACETRDTSGQAYVKDKTRKGSDHVFCPNYIIEKMIHIYPINNVYSTSRQRTIDSPTGLGGISEMDGAVSPSALL